jgi:cell division protein FtsQ
LRRPLIDPRIRERLVGVRRRQGQHRLRVVLGASGVVGVIVAVVVVLHSPLVRVEHVRVTGAKRTKVAAILRAARLDGHPLMVDVDAGVLARRVEALPWVGHVRASKDYPQTVRLVVTERSPAALVPAGGGTALVDATGRVLDVVANPPAGLPRLVGVPPLGAPGSVVPDGVRAALSVASAMPPGLVARAPEVAVVDGGELQLHVVPAGVVRFGPPNQVAEKLQAVSTILARADLRGLRVVDVRVPSAPVLTRA